MCLIILTILLAIGMLISLLLIPSLLFLSMLGYYFLMLKFMKHSKAAPTLLPQVSIIYSSPISKCSFNLMSKFLYSSFILLILVSILDAGLNTSKNQYLSSFLNQTNSYITYLRPFFF